MENKSEPYISVIYQLRVPAGTVKLLRESPVQGDAVRTLLSQVRKADQTTAKTACNRGGGGGVRDGGWVGERPFRGGHGPRGEWRRRKSATEW